MNINFIKFNDDINNNNIDNNDNAFIQNKICNDFIINENEDNKAENKNKDNDNWINNKNISDTLNKETPSENEKDNVNSYNEKIPEKKVICKKIEPNDVDNNFENWEKKMKHILEDKNETHPKDNKNNIKIGR